MVSNGPVIVKWIVKDLEGSGTLNKPYKLHICLKAMRETTKNVRIFGVQAEIRTGNLSNTSQEAYHFKQKAV
jgi:hypothetical protein